MMTKNRNHRGAGTRDGTAGEPHRDPLGRLLRDTDPATDRPGLDAVQRARMRQAVTEAASRSVPGRSGRGQQQAWMRPALAAASIAVVALGMWAINGGTFMEQAQDTEQAPNGASQPTVPEPTATAPEVGARESARPDPTVEARPAAATPDATVEALPQSATPDATVEVLPRSATPDANAAALPESVTTPERAAVTGGDKQPRTLQFTTPRGTRIIWTLDPNYESPIAGRERRQEQPR